MQLPFTAISLCLNCVCLKYDAALCRMSSCGVLSAYTLALIKQDRRCLRSRAVEKALGHALLHVLPVLLVHNPKVTPRGAAQRTGLLASLLFLWHRAGCQHQVYGYMQQPPHWRLGMLAYVIGAAFSARCT